LAGGIDIEEAMTAKDRAIVEVFIMFVEVVVVVVVVLVVVVVSSVDCDDQNTSYFLPFSNTESKTFS